MLKQYYLLKFTEIGLTEKMDTLKNTYWIPNQIFSK